MKTEFKPSSDETTSFAGRAAQLYGSDLHWFLLDRLKSDQDARDVIQEIYLRLLRLGKGELVRQPRAYVYFVARQVLAQFRMRARQSPVTYDSKLARHHDRHPGELREDEVATPLMALGEAEQLLAALPNMHRNVFLLRTLEGLSWPQIAEQLNISVHTVKKYLYEANARISVLRKAL